MVLNNVAENCGALAEERERRGAAAKKREEGKGAAGA